uniref:Uncharacterized protein n=1 Tax=Spongospora subterranea TaxID=70186 RepID=A0A0H5RB34_9EUKA|eukprot:CRZ10822.1 hypothetical protein [Spongospora subterranea]
MQEDVDNLLSGRWPSGIRSLAVLSLSLIVSSDLSLLLLLKCIQNSDPSFSPTLALIIITSIPFLASIRWLRIPHLNQRMETRRFFLPLSCYLLLSVIGTIGFINLVWASWMMSMVQVLALYSIGPVFDILCDSIPSAQAPWWSSTSAYSLIPMAIIKMSGIAIICGSSAMFAFVSYNLRTHRIRFDIPHTEQSLQLVFLIVSSRGLFAVRSVLNQAFILQAYRPRQENSHDHSRIALMHCVSGYVQPRLHLLDRLFGSRLSIFRRSLLLGFDQRSALMSDQLGLHLLSFPMAIFTHILNGETDQVGSMPSSLARSAAASIALSSISVMLAVRPAIYQTASMTVNWPTLTCAQSLTDMIINLSVLYFFSKSTDKVQIIAALACLVGNLIIAYGQDMHYRIIQQSMLLRNLQFSDSPGTIQKLAKARNILSKYEFELCLLNTIMLRGQNLNNEQIRNDLTASSPLPVLDRTTADQAVNTVSEPAADLGSLYRQRFFHSTEMAGEMALFK